MVPVHPNHPTATSLCGLWHGRLPNVRLLLLVVLLAASAAAATTELTSDQAVLWGLGSSAADAIAANNEGHRPQRQHSRQAIEVVPSSGTTQAQAEYQLTPAEVLAIKSLHIKGGPHNPHRRSTAEKPLSTSWTFDSAGVKPQVSRSLVEGLQGSTTAAEPLRKCSTQRSVKVRRTSQAVTPCIRGHLITFESGNIAANGDPNSFFGLIEDGYEGLYWTNWGYIDVPFYAFFFPGDVGLFPGTISGKYIATQAADPQGTPAAFGRTSGTFTLVSMYLTGVFWDGLTAVITADNGATLSVALSSTAPTKVVFGSAFKGVSYVELVTVGGQANPDYFLFKDDGSVAMDNVEVIFD